MAEKAPAQKIERVAEDGMVFTGLQVYAFSEIKLLKVDYVDGRGYVTEWSTETNSFGDEV